MSELVLSEALLSKLAGWMAMKQARSLLAADRVLASEWQAPTLRGAVQEGQTVYRAGLVIRSATDADNLCTCRDSRQRGVICGHSVAVGLHFLRPAARPAATAAKTAPAPARAPLEDFEPGEAKFKLRLAGGLAMLNATLECLSRNDSVEIGSATSPQSGQPVICSNLSVALAGVPPARRPPASESPFGVASCGASATQAAAERLRRAGFIGPDAAGSFRMNGQNLVLNFFARDYPRLEKEWEVTLEERLERSAENLERVQPRFQITPSGEQWFDLNVTYEASGGERLPPAEIQRLLLSGQSHTRLRNGKFALLDTGAVEELQEALVDCAPLQHDGVFRLDNTQAGFLDATLREAGGWTAQAPAAWAERAARQRGEIKIQAPPLGDLEAVLRPYQKEGVGWLHFLRANGFGGILADEMGLGKTVQVLAFLRALKERRGAAPANPSLVVCPTSLVFNWEAESKKFTPALSVLALHGAERRALFSDLARHDLLITSYALLRRDAALYGGMEFDTLVLDEAQHIKNRQTQNAQAVKVLRAAHRIVLTGTPLENSVLDLWSIFDFLMPGYLGAAADFRERCEIPIARDRSAPARARLARRLRPFLLRRRKREVASDLPERIEQVSYCELADGQRALYQQILAAGRREILDSVKTAGLARSRMVVLTALLRLRQICCDPRLLNAGAAAGPSGKVELFGELLEEVLDGGHRVLVFSQFTSMLALLRAQLEAGGIGYCYLDGSTQDRAAVVEKFQGDAGVPVFLISLKAGGVGLNLTGADTVIHFDPWWNPAVEAQATDRAHRIGQERVVTSYKLITRGTVEEKILALQNRKRTLTESLLGGEEQLTASLTWEEIQDLLAAET